MAVRLENLSKHILWARTSSGLFLLEGSEYKPPIQMDTSHCSMLVLEDGSTLPLLKILTRSVHLPPPVEGVIYVTSVPVADIAWANGRTDVLTSYQIPCAGKKKKIELEINSLLYGANVRKILV